MRNVKSLLIFLDVIVSINSQEFEPDLSCKSTDCHQFLEFSSAHPIHNKKSIVYSHGLNIKTLCSKKINLKNTLKVYVLGLTSKVIPKNLLKIKSGEFLRA